MDQNYDLLLKNVTLFIPSFVDIAFSFTAITLLSPLFVLVPVLIRLESEGKPFYSAKRAGSGYKVFDFYKFRSMYQDADKKLAALRAQNQYAKGCDAAGATFFKLCL